MDLVAQIFAVETSEDARALLPAVEAYLDACPTDVRVRRASEMLYMLVDESGDGRDAEAYADEFTVESGPNSSESAVRELSTGQVRSQNIQWMSMNATLLDQTDDLPEATKPTIAWGWDAERPGHA